MSTLRANELKKLDDTNWVGTEPTQVPTNDMIGEQGFEQAVDSVSALRLATFPVSLERLWLSGYYGAGTAGGGPLYRDSADTTTADNGGTVFVDGDGVRWKRAYSGHVEAVWFGVVGDGVADDTSAIEAALLESATDLGAAVSVRGCGTIRLTREILVPTRSFYMIGDGRMHVYPWSADGYTSPNKLSTILVDHNDRNGFTFKKDGGARGPHFKDINMVRSGTATCIAAFGFDTGGETSSAKDYGYDIKFDRCGIFDFVSAFDLYASTTTSEPTKAAIIIDGCAIGRNDWIARTLDSTAWNGFSFTNNMAGQQKVGGIDIRAHKFEEHGNYLEGMPNPIKLSDSFRGVVSFGSYFEANTGVALIDIGNNRGPISIKGHAVLADNTDTRVKLRNTGLINCDLPYIGDQVYKSHIPYFGDAPDVHNDMPNVDPSTYGVSSLNSPTSDVLVPPNGLITFESRNAPAHLLQRESSPFNGRAMPLGKATTSGSGATTTVLTLGGSAGDYVSVTFLMRHLPDGLDDPSPYLTLSVNGTRDAGSKDYNFSLAPRFFRQGDWMVLHAVIKLGAAMTSLNATLFPFGVNPAEGRVSHVLPAQGYTTADLRNCKPFLDEFTLHRRGSEPTAGTWTRGDVLYATVPTDYVGFVCTASGSPGTWKTFGAIST